MCSVSLDPLVVIYWRGFVSHAIIVLGPPFARRGHSGGHKMAVRSVVAHLVLFCGSLFVAFGILELSLRAIYPAPIRFLYPQEFYDFDAEMGHVLRPGQSAFTH